MLAPTVTSRFPRYDWTPNRQTARRDNASGEPLSHVRTQRVVRYQSCAATRAKSSRLHAPSDARSPERRVVVLAASPSLRAPQTTSSAWSARGPRPSEVMGACRRTPGTNVRLQVRKHPPYARPPHWTGLRQQRPRIAAAQHNVQPAADLAIVTHDAPLGQIAGSFLRHRPLALAGVATID